MTFVSRGATLALFLSTLPGCYVVSYSYPDAVPRSGATQEQKLQYKINNVPQLTLGGAYPQLVESMQRNGVFAQSIRVDDAPKSGLYVEVITQAKEMSTASLAWGYVSLSTLHILPAYSGSGGFNVRFHVSRDGHKIRIYEYPIRRQIFAWLPVLPLLWINALTDSESDAMSTTVEHFFADGVRDRVFDAAPPAEDGAVPIVVAPEP
jgi:hypothetical protein